MGRVTANVRFWRQPVPLSIQLATIIALLMLLCAVLIVAATSVFDALEEVRLIGLLKPEARAALETLLHGGQPTYRQLLVLIGEQRTLNEDGAYRSTIALVVSTLVAAMISFGFGVFLVQPIGRRLNAVARASQTIARGNFSARVATPRLASTEERRLIEDFNSMAESLANAERELKASSAAIAHELRTPLSVLKGRLMGIQDGIFAFGPDQTASLLGQVDMLVRLVEDLRTLSLIESGQPLLDMAEIDLADEARSLLAVIEPDLAGAGLDLHPDLRPARLTGDGARLRQVMVIALTNAMKYAAGSGPLQVRTGTENGMIVLRILDRGPGLGAEAEERAFERFWRQEQARTRSPGAPGGSGLGLSVARAIVGAHHGRVRLTSRPGGGAIFEMILPPEPPPLERNAGRAQPTRSDAAERR